MDSNYSYVIYVIVIYACLYLSLVGHVSLSLLMNCCTLNERWIASL